MKSCFRCQFLLRSFKNYSSLVMPLADVHIGIFRVLFCVIRLLEELDLVWARICWKNSTTGNSQ